MPQRTKFVIELPAGNRPGRSAWLGPFSLALAALCWFLPSGGALVGAAAVVCGALSIATRKEYRIDWTAVAGIGVGLAQLAWFLTLLGIT
ncbi:hypothetical protein EV191_12422 [Tamaricihabitans halophyticus]|uniref:DUF4190 domain-containing protein n=1 Tax=Tamaricihabitans halophyticus TaxID=1262583 RepID=A0A4V2SR86_9PSEU|nr:hypothetical protein EV191_12422 [Tamaricihabitans halophyticus]